MGIGISLILIAAGAILAYAVDYNASGVNLDAIGVILMIVGAIGLVFWLLFLASFAPFTWRRREEIDVDHVDHHGHGHI